MSEATRDEILDVIRETLELLEHPPAGDVLHVLTAQARKLRALVPTDQAHGDPWPRSRAVYLHSSKETMHEHGIELGLTGEALNKFTFALYELTLELAVNEDGTYKIVRIAE